MQCRLITYLLNLYFEKLASTLPRLNLYDYIPVESCCRGTRTFLFLVRGGFPTPCWLRHAARRGKGARLARNVRGDYWYWPCRRHAAPSPRCAWVASQSITVLLPSTADEGPRNRKRAERMTSAVRWHCQGEYDSIAHLVLWVSYFTMRFTVQKEIDLHINIFIYFD